MKSKKIFKILTVILVFASILMALLVFADVGPDSLESFGLMSLLPPVLTIILAFITKQVVLSLLAGVYIGAFMLTGFNPIEAFMRTFETYVTGSIVNAGHAGIIIFTTSIGGMLAIVAKMGGTQAIANHLIKKAKTARSAQIITMLLGCLVFFDDYANILVVGPTMQPLTDRLKISREKLTYYVHTTAGIVAGIAVMTTWIGFEMGLVNDAFAELGYDVNAFNIILKNIPFMFYNIFAIAISFLVAVMMKDFGPMYAAERRTRLTGKVVADDARLLKSDSSKDDNEQGKGKAYYAIIPILTMVLIIFFGLWYSGYKSSDPGIDPFTLEGFSTCFGNVDPMPVIVWAAISSSLVAGIIAVSTKIMKVPEVYETWLEGSAGLFEVCIILILAWSLGTIISEIGTAEYLIIKMTNNIPGAFIPTIVFIISCIISFSTGTSWGTMPIVFPLAIPLAATYVTDPTTSPLVIATIAAVLSGSIFGDQTSPISDSTILSASSSGCDPLHHIKTQMPYAIVPAVAATISYLLVGILNLNVLFILILGITSISLFINFFGKSTKAEDLEKLEKLNY